MNTAVALYFLVMGSVIGCEWTLVGLMASGALDW